MQGMRLAQVGIDVYMINFGQPRTGDIDYANFSNEKFPKQWRVTQHQDQVPHLPMRTPVLNYHHVRTEVYVDVDLSMRVCDASGEDPTCAD